MTPVVLATYVPVSFNWLNGNCVSRPEISPPVEYQVQNAADVYLLAYSMAMAIGQGSPTARGLARLELPMVDMG